MLTGPPNNPFDTMVQELQTLRGSLHSAGEIISAATEIEQPISSFTEAFIYPAPVFVRSVSPSQTNPAEVLDQQLSNQTAKSKTRTPMPALQPPQKPVPKFFAKK